MKRCLLLSAADPCSQPLLGAPAGGALQRREQTSGGAGHALGHGSSPGGCPHRHHSHRHSPLQEVSPDASSRGRAKVWAPPLRASVNVAQSAGGGRHGKDIKSESEPPAGAP